VTADRNTDAVTFLFTDIEGSTRLWEQDAERMRTALACHDALARTAVERHGGIVVKTIGDGVHAAFDDACNAVAASVALQQALSNPAATHGIALRVRCGLHAGAVERRDNDYFGTAVNRAARIMGAAHGGQVLLSQAVSEIVVSRLPHGVTLRDLGLVRLRDLASPERIYQVLHPQLREQFPALRSLEATPNNLPQQVTSFVGRERVLAEAKKALAATRLLTLTGVGGLGKTRLSLQIAADVIDDYPDGVWLVELAAVADPQIVPQAVASVLGVKEEPARSVLDALVAHAKDRRLLILLDNCEHVVDACARLAERLLAGTTALEIVASSREPLRIAGETVYALPPLTLPAAAASVGVDTVLQSEAARLFVERAQSVKPAFAVTAQDAPALADICRRLDGIPLAIELAAARTGTLPLQAIAARLTDRFALLTRGSRTALPRQQTLRAMIDWSHDLLEHAEQQLFLRLSVFAGGFTLDAAEALGADDARDVLDLLGALVDKSLVELDAGGARYRLLETVREYARERLQASGAQTYWRARHFAWCLALCETAEPHLTGASQQAWLDRLAAEHDNLRAGLAWSTADAGDAAGALRLAAALWLFWYVRGHVSEGRASLDAALAASAGADAPPVRAKALRGAGVLAYHQGDYAASRRFHEACLAILRQQDDQRGIASSLGSLGIVAYDLGEYGNARALLEQSLAIQRRLGDRRGTAMSLNNLGGLLCDQGDHAAARPLHEESLAIKRELGDRRGIAMSLNNLGDVASHEGDLARARSLHEESLAIRRELGDQWGIAMSLSNLGDVALHRSDLASARALHHECLAIRRTLGDRRGMADSLEALAFIAVESGDAERALRIFGAAERLREEIRAPLQTSERASYDRHVADARTALGDAAFSRAWAEGRSLALDEAIARIL
jgi:predicted ATPase/class 3 adenylate cyclase